MLNNKEDKLLSQLRYFHFKRAIGGHANDGDSLDANFIYTDRNDLVDKFRQIGIIFEDTYPGWTVIFGCKVFVYLSGNCIQISVAGTKDGNTYEVTEDDIQVCLQLEGEFDKLGWKQFLYVA